MAINDKTQRVVLKFSVDAEGVILGVQQITNEIGKAEKKAKDAGKGVSDFWGAIDGTIERAKRQYADIATIATAAIGLAKGALDSMRLEVGAAGVSIEGLTRASAGLRTQDQLMADAIKFKSAAFRLSQQDMEDVEGAMRKLTREGKDQEKVYQAITQSLATLNTGGLQELGISVQKAGLSMDDASDRGELFKRIMQQLQIESQGVADVELTKQERMAQTGVAFQDAVSQIKDALGNMVIALTPLIRKVAELVALAPKAGKGIGEIGGKLYKGWMTEVMGMGDDIWMPENGDAGVRADLAARIRKSQRIRELALAGNSIGADRLALGTSEDLGEGELAGLLASMGGGLLGPDRIGTPVGRDYKGKGARDKGASQAAQAAMKEIAAQQALAWDMFKNDVEAYLNEIGDVRYEQGSGLEMAKAQTDVLDAAITKLLNDEPGKRNEQAYEKYRGESQSSFMESTFGPVGQFNAYKAAFDGFTSSVTAGYSAMVDGTMSFGKAFKMSVADALKATGAQMLIESLKEAAYGVASLAIGNAPGAAAHFKSSALFAAGSIAAGVAAGQIGTSVSVTAADAAAAKASGAGAGAAASGGAPAANANPQSSIVYVVGDPFDTETNPRRRQNSARKLVENIGRGTGTMGGSY